MSYAYRIQLPEAQTTVTEEGLWTPELLPLISESDLHALLRSELVQRGWAEEDDGSLKGEVEGVQVELLPDRVALRAHLQSEVTVSHIVIADSDDSVELKALRIAEGERQRDRLLTEASEERGRALTSTLIKLEPHINRLLDETLSAIYPLALLQRAEELGEILSVSRSESEEEGLEVTIHVKVDL